MKLEAINSSPVACFRWLKVNDITVEIPFVATDGAGKNTLPKVLPQQGISFGAYKGMLEQPGEKELVEQLPHLLQTHANQGFTLEIAPGQQIERPIEIGYSATPQQPSLLDVSEIIAGANSSATVVLLYTQQEGMEQAARISRLQVQAQAGSRLKIIKVGLLDNTVETLLLEQQEYAQTQVVCVDFGTQNTVGKYRCTLAGEGSTNTLQTAYFGQQKDTLDFTFQADLKGRNTKAAMDTRGILGGNAQKTMRAALHFHQGAKRAKGAESEYVMLISDEVKNSSIPLLLCDEDDVAGEHAAGIGRVDENTMFYLTSRGFTPQQAKNILVRGYLDPILAQLKGFAFAPLLEQQIEKRMVAE